MQASLDTEFGGMNEVLANLYAVTGNPEHLRIARKLSIISGVFDPLAASAKTASTACTPTRRSRR